MKTSYSILIFLLLASILFSPACGDSESADEMAESAVQFVGNPLIDGLSQKIAENPDNPDLYAQRAQAFYENEGYDGAIQDLKKALSYDSTKLEYLHLLTDVYLDYYKSRLAVETMEKAIQMHPNDIPSLLKLAELQLILKKHDLSMQTLGRVLQLDPQNAEAYFQLGLNFEEKGDTARAINSFQEAVEIEPDLEDGWLNLGQLFAAMGNPIAIKYFDNAVRVDSSVTALHMKAYYLANSLDDLEGALDIYKTISRMDMQYEDAYYNSGLLYLDMDKPEEAKKQFDLTISVEPTHERAYYYRGITWEMLGNPAAAQNDYEQALRLSPDFRAAQEGLERVRQAEVQ